MERGRFAAGVNVGARAEKIDSHEGPPPAPRLLDQVRARIRVLHYCIRTEEQQVRAIKRFVVFHNMRHLVALGKAPVEAFRFALAVDIGLGGRRVVVEGIHPAR